MLNVQGKFASALFLSVAAGAVWTMLPQQSVLAADNCLTQPTDPTPQGQHWYYHIERGTGRHCWYLRGEDEKSARMDTPAAEEPEQPAPRRTEASPSRSIADAHAEMPSRARAAGDAPAAAPSVWPSAAFAPPPANNGATNARTPNVSASPLAARWPQESGQGSGAAAANQPQASQPSPNQPAASQPPEETLMLADAQGSDATDASQTLPPPTPAVAPVERYTGSIQKLLLVAAGALALAGLTGSAVYRLGRRRRRNDWLRERTAWKSAQNPNDPPWVEPRFARASSIPDLDQARLAAEESDFSRAMSEGDQFDMSEGDQFDMSEGDQADMSEGDQADMSEGDQTDERVEKIEDYLARLTQQLHDEMKGANAKRAERDVRAAS